MPTAHSNRGRKTPSRLKELKERLATLPLYFTTLPQSTLPPSTEPPTTEPPSTEPPSTAFTTLPLYFTTLPQSTLPPSTEPPSTASPTTDCQAGWSESNGECYKYFSQEKTWDDAEDQCVAEQVRQHHLCL